MRTRSWKPVLLGLLCVVGWGASAHAVVNCEWVHPCPCGDRDGNGEWSCGFGGFQCRCETDFDTSDNWYCPNSSPPTASGDIADIEHSNHGCCSNDDACSIDDDCSGSCGDIEVWLKIDIVTATIYGLVLDTESTAATTDKLTVKFESVDGAGNTLTPGYVILDATNGVIKFELSDKAAVHTSTSG